VALLTRRLQVLIDTDRYAGLEREAARRGVSIAEVVREAIDRALRDTGEGDREAALNRYLAGPEIDVGDWEDVKEELAAAVDRW
jgi:Arc/MetJ-type ribon-helix-helix transcriptional regulator